MIALWGHLHQGSRNKCCSRCYICGAGESLVLHTEMLTFPFLCFPLFFPFPEQDRLVSHCPVCSHWPPRSPLSPSHVTAHGSMHSTSARPQERGGPCTPGPLSTELNAVGKLCDWKRCPHPSSQQCCFVLGEKCSFITWVPGTGRDKQGYK